MVNRDFSALLKYCLEKNYVAKIIIDYHGLFRVKLIYSGVSTQIKLGH